jgi:hypothetical protein
MIFDLGAVDRGPEPGLAVRVRAVEGDLSSHAAPS